ncbi:FliG C-terminal domain-containing protein [Thiomicrorhabdus arctica]|uniref:FliG C-terminal domain-containing protein n=1 Tax=Thiomicrorhabdus arctica TaxID=131540 RepID=UPI00035FC371|nr:FliG C-terminal domain-containing protein [Thiomicrorhabdus arctica]
MKVGLKKLHENEWLVHMGCAAVKMDQFSVALLNITLAHLLALEQGESHSMLKSYIKLGLRIKALKDLECQNLLRVLDNKDILMFMMVANDPELNDLIMKNTGGILAKQFEADLANASMPNKEILKGAIRRIVEKTFELESLGQIEFTSTDTKYI